MWANRSVDSASYLAENGPGSLRTLFAFAIITLITSAFVPSGIPTGEGCGVDGENCVHDEVFVQLNFRLTRAEIRTRCCCLRQKSEAQKFSPCRLGLSWRYYRFWVILNSTVLWVPPAIWRRTGQIAYERSSRRSSRSTRARASDRSSRAITAMMLRSEFIISNPKIL